MQSNIESAFKLRSDPFLKTRDLIEKDLKRKLARQLKLINPKTNAVEYQEISTILGGSSVISNAQKIRDSLLSDQKITSHTTRSVIDRNL